MWEVFEVVEERSGGSGGGAEWEKVQFGGAEIRLNEVRKRLTKG